MCKNLFSIILLPLSIALAGFFIYLGFSSFANRDRSVTVKGLSEVRREADRVIWPIIYSEVGNDLAALYNKTEANNAIVVEFLTSNGIAKEDIFVNAPSMLDAQANIYSSNDRPAYRFVLKQTITVSTRQVAKVRELMTKQAALLSKNIALTSQEWEGPSYEFEGLDSLKPNMIREATQNARLSAEKFAEDSGAAIGDIKKASQGQVTIEDLDKNTPYIKKIRVVTTVEYDLR